MPNNPKTRELEVDELDPRQDKELVLALGKADTMLSKLYLNAIGTAPVVPIDTRIATKSDAATLNKTIRFFEVAQVVLDSSENPRDKLVSVFNAVGSAGAGLLMLIQGTKVSVSIKMGIKAPDEESVGKCGSILQSSLIGNFPGTKIEPVRVDGLADALKRTFGSNVPAVVSVTDVAGIRSEQESKERLFMQGIEKVVDAMRGREYSLLLVSDPVSPADLAASRRSLENLYSSLVPFSESQITLGANESEAVSKSISKNVSDSISKSVSDTVSKTVGKTTSNTYGVNAGGGIPFVANAGVSYSYGESDSISDTNSKTIGQIDAHTVGETGTDGKTITSGGSRSLQLKFENHAVKELLKKIDKTLERYDICADIGMWNSAVYIMSTNPTDAEMAANVYHSVVRGKNSSLETGCVAVWDDQTTVGAIEYLKRMAHPIIDVSGMRVTPGTLISSAELAIAAGLPNRSLPGLPVLECARFGRTVSTYDVTNPDVGETYSVELGKIWNMNQEEELPVRLNPDSLASHTFITGSTGSGKSNTVYRILSELRSKAATFLVVEPAKGEYKDVLGGAADVMVYGTNPSLTSLLRINPFSFPHGDGNPAKNIHILEHLDRLVEIFNVCWPMYAAMPAVLKDAIEKAYRECGWNLTDSTNPYGKNLFPTFADVARCVKRVIDTSEYDAENKGAYKGSLLTRLASLTNGINSLVFTPNELSAEDLFDRNVIADLSRVGSSETKSLIMGVLVLKLQEHRMTGGLMNASLRHVTVLEEAHNLLRKSGNSSSTGESGGGASLLAKSVEMLANAIAEMRTYGEGFIIADQSPGLLDMSAIRNTNTKIVMRLPDRGDRELVGKAMHLDDAQIAELARLPRGVAAVCQNEWVESVLCRVKKYDAVTGTGGNKQSFENVIQSSLKSPEYDESTSIAIADFVLNGSPLPPSVVDDISEGRVPLSARSRVVIQKVIKREIEPPKFTQTGVVIAELFPRAVEALRNSVERTTNNEIWTKEVMEALPEVQQQLQHDIVQAVVTETLLNELNKRNEFNAWYEGGFPK